MIFTKSEPLNLIVCEYTALKKLTVLGSFKSLEPISGLTQLESLTLSSTYFKTSYIAEMKNLKYLDISRNGLRNISDLGELTQLEYLDISYNPVENLSVLKNFKKFRTFKYEISHRDPYSTDPLISTLPSVSKLPLLEELDISGQYLYDLSFLKRFPALRSLKMSGVRLRRRGELKDIVPDAKMKSAVSDELASLKNLQILDLSRTSARNEGFQYYPLVDDYSFLSELTDLREFNIEGNRIRFDISQLKGAKKLEKLEVRGNTITDFSALSELKDLRYFSSDSEIKDLSVFEGLTSLEHLRLEYCRASYVSPLSGLKALKVLALYTYYESSAAYDFCFLDKEEEAAEIPDEDKITDISPLSGLTELEELALSVNNISDISPLAGMTKLKTLDLSHNNITDVSPLRDLRELKTLGLPYNNIGSVIIFMA